MINIRKQEGGAGGNDPTIDKKELIKRVIETIDAATLFLRKHECDLDELIRAESFGKLSLLKRIANGMC